MVTRLTRRPALLRGPVQLAGSPGRKPGLREVDGAGIARGDGAAGAVPLRAEVVPQEAPGPELYMAPGGYLDLYRWRLIAMAGKKMAGLAGMLRGESPKLNSY